MRKTWVKPEITCAKTGPGAVTEGDNFDFVITQKGYDDAEASVELKFDDVQVRADLVRFRESVDDEPVESPVDERTVDGEDPAEVTARREFASQRESVGRSLREEGKHHPLGQRQLDPVGSGRRRLAHRPMSVAVVPV